jgi:hypothetical protein
MECLNKISGTKTYICSLLIIVFILFLYSVTDAYVSGYRCSNCHTIHNSQSGVADAYKLNTDKTGYVTDETPNAYLLKSDCIGCHSAVGTGTIDGNNTPIVFTTSDPTDPLAGGNFKYVLGDDAKGHNVNTVVIQDLTLGLTPPGALGGAMSSQLRCAGSLGCHGDRGVSGAYSSMYGAHHTIDTGGITGTSVGLSYRFLDGILGKEDDDWEQDNTNTSHNEYKGSDTTESISYLCSICHGYFHSTDYTNASSPFKRHPTDMALPLTGEFSSYTSYSMTAPVARPDPDGVADTTLVETGDMVMCLSCHRAHASDNYKILRWNTKGTVSEAISGCSVCHTSKN